MTMAMRGVVLALLVLRRVPGSHSPTLYIEGWAYRMMLFIFAIMLSLCRDYAVCGKSLK